jgi:hypothetical protein
MVEQKCYSSNELSPMIVDEYEITMDNRAEKRNWSILHSVDRLDADYTNTSAIYSWRK